MNILWGMGFEQFDNIKGGFSSILKESQSQVNIIEKFNKKGILNEVKDPSNGIKYDLLVIFEFIEKQPIDTAMLEEIVDTDSDLKIIFCLSNDHSGDNYAKAVVNLGIFNCIYVSEFSAEKLHSLYQSPRKRMEAKMYLGAMKNFAEQDQPIDKETITKIIYNLLKEPKEGRISLYRHIASQYSEDENLFLLKHIEGELLEDLKSEPLVDAYIKTAIEKPVQHDKGIFSFLSSKDVVVDDDGGIPVKVVTKKQVVFKDRHVEIEKIVKFKSSIISVVDNSEFACEFAYNAAEQSKYDVILINLDSINGNLDIYFNLNNAFENNSLSNALTNFDSVGNRTEIFKENVVKVTDKLHVLSDRPGYEKMPRYNEANVVELIELAYNRFDLVIVNINSLFSIFSQPLMGVFDYFVFALNIGSDKMQIAKIFMDYCMSKYSISAEVFLIVAYEYQKGISASVGTLKRIYGDCFLGCIDYDRYRVLFRDIEDKTGIYSKYAYDKNKHQYEKILRFFNITPELTFYEKMISVIDSVFKRNKKVLDKED